MLVLVLTAAGGQFAQNKCVGAARQCGSARSRSSSPSASPFIMADSLLSATYYGGDNAWRFWLAACCFFNPAAALGRGRVARRPVARDASSSP